MITIVDYGVGNLYSIKRALEYIGADPIVTGRLEEISNADRLLLPGVGAFGKGVENLRKKELVEPIKRFIGSGKPFLGICLGMQLLMETSEELGRHEGLQLITGKVVRLAPSGDRYKIPHVGWNELESQNRNNDWDKTVLEGLNSGNVVYFAHSYVVVPDDDSCVLATTTYGRHRFCSVLKKDNVYGCQFHPEKSGRIGLRILKNFLEE